jgi:beta-lactamase regulating signal transducer with metallopeptidase domain
VANDRSRITPATASSRNPTPRYTWSTWLLFVWLGGVCLLVARLSVQRLRLRGLLRRCQPLQDQLLERIVSESAAAIELTRLPTVLLSDEIRSPFVCGLWRPTLVLTANLTETLDEQQLRQAVLHELAHLWRRDLLWSWLPELVRISYWPHPAAHWIRYRTRLERELACDQLALAHSGRCASSYAEMLVRVVSRASEPQVLRAAPASRP